MKSTSEHSSDELDLKIFYLPLLRFWKVILSGGFVAAIVAALYSLTLERYYDVHAVIMSGNSSSSGSVLSELRGGMPLMGLLGVSGGDQALQKYESIMKSYSFVRKMIDDHGLYEKLMEDPESFQEFPAEERKERIVKNLIGGVTIEVVPPVLTIIYRSTDAEAAYFVINAYLESLREFINSHMLTQAKNTELFIKERLSDALKKLSEIEQSYLALQTKTGVFQLPIQSGQAIGAASNLEAQLIEKDMEIALLKDLMTSSSEIKRLEAERDQIQTQLNKLIQGRSSRGGADDSAKKVFTAIKDIPGLEMDFASARRDYLVQGRLVELLQKQLEIAQIETKKSDPIFQIVDEPVVPILPAGPSRRMITLVGAMIGFFLFSVGAIVYYHLPTQASERLGRISAPILTIVARRRNVRAAMRR